MDLLDVADDVRKDVADGGSEKSQDDDHDDRNQNQNQGIFDETLTSLIPEQVGDTN